MSEIQTDVLVVGAGPSGLAVAAVLARYGVDFQVVDAKSGPVEQSRAALVHVRTLELLDRLDLAEAAVARGVKVNTVEIAERGRQAGSFPLVDREAAQTTPYPYALGLEQHQTEHLLAEHLTSWRRPVKWGVALEALTVRVEGARAVVRREDGVQDAITARWVVGADGARSRVRHALGIGLRGGTFGQTGLLADLDLELPHREELRPGTLRLNLTRGGFVGLFALPSGRYRLFGAVPPNLTTAQRGTQVSHEAYAEVTPPDLQRWLDEYFALDARIHHTTWTALYRIHSRCAEHFRTGDIFLVGDAAHLHSPAGGQGMNLGLGDGFNLGWKLALVATGQAHETLLDSYESERYPIARAVLRGSDRGFALETTPNPLARWLRANIGTRLITPLTRLRSVRAAIFKLFSQTWIRYPHSLVTANDKRHRGRPRPGDRAPFGHLDTAHGKASVFDLCGGTAHHLLFFHGPTPSPDLPSVRTAIQSLVSAYAIPIEVHDVSADQTGLHARYGVTAPSLFLIRPDGYISYIGTPDELQRLEAHLDHIYVRRQRGDPARPN
ncbi:hypothetical protein EF847_15995 [Actinobacteria bacterium YIM 96077]|uniref:FAD-binding domain-containing protein n=1 Tax=Phytoactinopolyspora halophila TaxID=1981511 RepID=A0A329QB04_9ACTN|nr:FAD-dependent monooxygenase [Phytoactinopolyspora halophila]AYY13978.1 hypothetical protein EF847_15995 [Actinobacteria bacterium YIM 96077]RAW09417.1 hypothetical protein DPM12_21450 [Phytoactinopolyspora halophila]